MFSKFALLTSFNSSGEGLLKYKHAIKKEIRIFQIQYEVNILLLVPIFSLLKKRTLQSHLQYCTQCRMFPNGIEFKNIIDLQVGSSYEINGPFFECQGRVSKCFLTWILPPKTKKIFSGTISHRSYRCLMRHQCDPKSVTLRRQFQRKF